MILDGMDRRFGSAQEKRTDYPDGLQDLSLNECSKPLDVYGDVWILGQEIFPAIETR